MKQALLFQEHAAATDAARFVARFAWAYERWLEDPDQWLGLAGPVLDEHGWLCFSGMARVCPINLLHRLARRDRQRGIRRTRPELERLIERHWPKCAEDAA